MSDVLDKWSLLDIALRADRLNTALSTGMFDKWAIDDPALFQSRFEMLKGPSGLGPWSILDDELSQMLMNAALSGGPSPPPYVASAVHFDNVSFLEQDSTSIPDTSVWSFSGWCQFADTSTFPYVWDLYAPSGGGLNYVAIGANFNTDISFQAGHLNTPSPTSFFNFGSADGLFQLNTWTHIAGSVNTNFAAGLKIGQLYVNRLNVLDPAVTNDSAPAFDASWSGSDFYIPDNSTDGPPGNDAADMQWWIGQFIDWSVPSNLAKVIDSNGKPVDPAIAAAAFGQQTVLFTGDASTFGTNQGTAGAFALTGTLTNAATHP